MSCPGCGKESAGRFCPDCGTPLDDAHCARCNALLVPGAKYCTQCGAAVRTATTPGNLGWYAAAGVLIVMIAVLLILTNRDRGAGADAANAPPAAMDATQAPFAQGGASSTATPPPLTGTPREQADRLFNRIMEERASGDTAQGNFFLPMAVAAYQQVPQLDNDGLYHLSLLQNLAGDPDGALASAERVLTDYPKHLLALAAAAQAAAAAGHNEKARAYYQRFLDAYPTEKTKSVAEYLDHARVLPEYQDEARRFTAR